MDESLDGLLNQFLAWKDNFDARGLWVNMSKTKILVSNPPTINIPLTPVNIHVVSAGRELAATQYFFTTVKVGSSIVAQT